MLEVRSLSGEAWELGQDEGLGLWVSGLGLQTLRLYGGYIGGLRAWGLGFRIKVSGLGMKHTVMGT